MSKPSFDSARLAFAFPGVGVRPCGHEGAFYRRHEPVMAPLLAEASDCSGCDLAAVLFDEARQRAMSELQAQIFTYGLGAAVAAVFLRHGGSPRLMAGHSMGIYAALASAGVVSFADGLSIAAEAFRLVTEASAGLDAGMAVIVGLGHDEVDALLAALGPESTALRVNDNNEVTTVLAGLRPHLARAVEAALGRGALKARLLPVGAPYHHAGLLAGATETLAAFLRSFAWSAPRCPVVSSIDQRLLREPEDLLDLTARNISEPIAWEQVLRTLIENGIELVVECGAGVSLRDNGRLVPACPPFVTVRNAARRAGL